MPIFSATEINESFDIFFNSEHIPPSLALDGLTEFLVHQSRRQILYDQKEKKNLNYHHDTTTEKKEEGGNVNKETEHWHRKRPTTAAEYRQQASKVSTLLRPLILETNALGVILLNMTKKKEGKEKCIVQLRNVLKLPDLISRVLQRQTPDWLARSSTWHAAMSKQLTTYCIGPWLQEYENESDEDEDNERVVVVLASLVTTLCRVTSAGSVARGWCNMLNGCLQQKLQHAALGGPMEDTKLLYKHGVLLREMDIDVVESMLVACLKEIVVVQTDRDMEDREVDVGLQQGGMQLIEWFANAVHYTTTTEKETPKEIKEIKGTKGTAPPKGKLFRNSSPLLHTLFTKRLLFHYEFVCWKVVWRMLDVVVSPTKKDQISKDRLSQQEMEQNQIVTALAGVWCDPEFVMSTNWSRHQYVSRLLLYSLQMWMTPPQSDSELELESDLTASPKLSSNRLEKSGCLNYLLSGVQHHLEHGVQRVRLIGMRMAQTFSTILDPTQPLIFQELLDSVPHIEEPHETPAASSMSPSVSPSASPSISPSVAPPVAPFLATSSAASLEGVFDDDPDELVTYSNSSSSSRNRNTGQLRKEQYSYSSSSSNSDHASSCSDEEDSDDDLLPYDMDDTNDTNGQGQQSDGRSTASVPVYARDVLALMEQSQKEGGRECYDAYTMWKKMVAGKTNSALSSRHNRSLLKNSTCDLQHYAVALGELD